VSNGDGGEWGIIRHDEKGNVLNEHVRERLFVKEDIGVAEALVEAVFHLLNAFYHALDIPIARQHDDSRIGPTIQDERWFWRVVLLWDHIM